MIIYFLLLIFLFFLYKIIKYLVDKNRIIITKKGNNPENIIITEYNIYDCCHDYLDTIYRDNQLIIKYHNSFDNLIKLSKILDKINNNTNKFIFIMKIIPNLKLDKYNNCYLLNTEQLTRKNCLEYIKKIIKIKNIKLLDYSFGNINILNKHNIKTKYLPYQKYESEIFNYTKDYDVAIIGLDLINDCSSRRYQIYSKLKNLGVKINNITGFYDDRDKLLFKHKILLNIHYDKDYKIFEEIRCTRCVFNKMIVITEESQNLEEYMYYDKIIEVKYDKIIDKTLEILKNYDYNYKMLFDNKIKVY